MTSVDGRSWLYLRDAASLNAAQIRTAVATALRFGEDADALVLSVGISHPSGFSGMGSLIGALAAQEIGLEAAEVGLPRAARPGSTMSSRMTEDGISIASGAAREWQAILPDVPFTVRTLLVSPTDEYLAQLDAAVGEAVAQAQELRGSTPSAAKLLDAIALVASCDKVLPQSIATRLIANGSGREPDLGEALAPLSGLAGRSQEFLGGKERDAIIHPGERWGAVFFGAIERREAESRVVGALQSLLAAVDPSDEFERDFARRLLAAARRVHGLRVLRDTIAPASRNATGPHDTVTALATWLEQLGQAVQQFDPEAPYGQEDLADWAALTLAAGNYRLGLRMLEKAPATAPLMLQRALLLERQSLAEGTRTTLEEAQHLFETLRSQGEGRDPYFCLSYARFLERRGAPGVQEWYREATRTHRGNVFLLTARAAYTLHEGDDRGASETIALAEREAAGVLSALAYTAHLRGEVARRRLNHREAEAAFRTLLSQTPEHLPSLVSLGGMFSQLGYDATARYWLERALDVDRENEPGRLLFAQLLGQSPQERDWTEAERLLHGLIADAPGQEEAHTALAKLLRHRGQAQEARNALDRMPESVRGEPYRLAELAQLDLLDGDYERAWDRLDRVHRTGAESVALTLQGRLECRRSGTLRDDLFGAALDRAPGLFGRIRILNTWAECAAELNAQDRAASLIAQSLAIDPHNRFTAELAVTHGVARHSTHEPEQLRGALITFLDSPSKEAQWTTI